MDNKAKIVLIIVGVVLLFIIATGVGEREMSTSELSINPQEIIANAQVDSKDAENLPKKEFREISLAEYLNYYQGSEEKLILLARPTCGYCQIAEPIIAAVAEEYNIEIFYLNTDNFEGDDQTMFVQSNKEFYEGYGTPLLFIVKDSNIIDMVDGLTDRAHYIEFFKNHNYIKG